LHADSRCSPIRPGSSCSTSSAAAKPACQELTDTIGSTQQNVSKHLGVLRREGIVHRTKRGNYSYYSIADEGVFALCEDVCGGLAGQLESLREVVAGVGR
jgi:DNA-binding transcriptional ArsR family regulator